MEEQFILRVPPSVAEKIESLLNDSAAASDDKSLDLSFMEDGRTGTFTIGEDQFPASLLDLPCVVESYKTYDDNVLIKTADVGQSVPDTLEFRHGLTPPMRDVRKRRFRREPDLNPELVQRVERELRSIPAGGTVPDHDDEGDENAATRTAGKKLVVTSGAKPAVQAARPTVTEADRSDSDDTDESIDV
uniref:TAFII55 protein conserved region domain-containing protein n=1 Tax=Kalanchoe fedtschenkoi TaxID=63787 RepID=A0A7N0TZ92_KALFE